MNCEELLVQQAIATKHATNTTSRTLHIKVFVYRNIVKALPWFTSVRTKLDDPTYSGFLLKFDTTQVQQYHQPMCANENHTHCSTYYHDQGQTPQVPTTDLPYPDGVCSDKYCDCGKNPCGEYLFDHRNGTMRREWLIEEIILGPSAIGHAAIDGLFLDVFWCSDLLCRQKSEFHTWWLPLSRSGSRPYGHRSRCTNRDGLVGSRYIADLTIQWNILQWERYSEQF